MNLDPERGQSCPRGVPLSLGADRIVRAPAGSWSQFASALWRCFLSMDHSLGGSSSARPALWKHDLLPSRGSRSPPLRSALFLALLLIGSLRADVGNVVLRVQGTNTLLQVQGDADEDWVLQTSINLLTWTTLFSGAPLLGGDLTNAPARSAGTHTEPQRFYRAVKR